MNAEFTVSATAGFTKAVQRLSKKYPSLRNDLVEVRTQLQNDPQSGTPLGKDCYKIRLKIASKNTGKAAAGEWSRM